LGLGKWEVVAGPYVLVGKNHSRGWKGKVPKKKGFFWAPNIPTLRVVLGGEHVRLPVKPKSVLEVG